MKVNEIRIYCVVIITNIENEWEDGNKVEKKMILYRLWMLKEETKGPKGVDKSW